MLNLVPDNQTTATNDAQNEGKKYPVLYGGADGGFQHYCPSGVPSAILIAPNKNVLNDNIYPTTDKINNAFSATGNINPHSCTASLTAKFNCDNTNIVEGGQVNFTDISTDGGSAITSWSWTFTGGNPSSFNGQNPPAITYNNAGSYEVKLTVTNANGSDTETKPGYIHVLPTSSLFTLDFESLSNYSKDFSPWSNVDNDGKATYSSSDCDFTGEASAFGFMAFNPTDAGFSIANAHGGQRCGMAICPSDKSASDNWIISSKINVSTGSSFKFWVLSPKPSNWGNETFNVLVSTSNNNLSSFSAIASNEEAPSSWTLKEYDLSNYQGQEIYVAIQHISVDKFMFFIDDIEITGVLTETDNINYDDIKVYPNPATDKITITNVLNSTIEIRDIKGKVIMSKIADSDIINIDLSHIDKGSYFIKIINDKNILIKKIIIN